MNSIISESDSSVSVSHNATELLQFLSPSSLPKARADAVEFLLGLTGSAEGIELLGQNWKLLGAMIEIAFSSDASDVKVQENSIKCLVNLSADANTAAELIIRLRFISRLVQRCTVASASEVNRVTGSDTNLGADELIDLTCVVLSNVSQDEVCAEKVTRVLEESPNLETSLANVVECFVKHCHCRHQIGAFLSNITQVRRVRRLILDREKGMFQRLVPFLDYAPSLVRRTGVTGAVRNCCFEAEFHDWLLSEDGADLLPRLLLPLAGPEEFDEEDTNKLPLDLQYLPSDKQREADAAIRRMLVESINQLCATKNGRSLVHSRGYVILREYHSWETDETNRTALDNLISVIISDEPPPEFENLNEVEIPEKIRLELEKAAADASTT